MKVLRYIILPTAIALLPSCTQNNGHIGPLFGSWHLEAMTCDGENIAQPKGTDTYWNFQGAVINVLLVDTMYESFFYIGTWEFESDDMLALDFTHRSDIAEPGTGFYEAPAWMGFPANEVLRLDVCRLDGSHMTLGWTSDEGKKYTYNFNKTW